MGNADTAEQQRSPAPMALVLVAVEMPHLRHQLAPPSIDPGTGTRRHGESHSVQTGTAVWQPMEPFLR